MQGAGACVCVHACRCAPPFKSLFHSDIMDSLVYSVIFDLTDDTYVFPINVLEKSNFG